MGLERKGAETNINFWFGTAIHFAMEDYFGYNKFGDPRRAFKAYYNSFKPEDRPEGAEEHYDLGLAMLTYFLEWYPKHNNDMQFQTLWLDEKDQQVLPNTPGSRPAVEQEFLFDLGYRVLVDVATGKMIKEWDREHDMLFDIETYHPEWSKNDRMEPDKVEIGEGARHYYWMHKVDRDAITFVGQTTSMELTEVKVVPICYHGTMDKMVTDRFGRWWILDYKTAKGADTRKLETDDQISAYMWAAEQRFQHPIYGFIYLQLTKDVAKPPKRLKDGSLSVDKKQKTTYCLFKEEVIKDFGSVNKAPNKIVDMLNHLADLDEPEGDRFIRWDFVTRNANQKIETYKNILAETKMMLDTTMRLYPNPTRDCGWDCPFRQICIAMDKGEEDIQPLIDLEFQVRDDTLEHNDDDWRVNIKWPDTPMEAAKIDDVELKPSNIFNIELPEKYYNSIYEED